MVRVRDIWFFFSTTRTNSLIRMFMQGQVPWCEAPKHPSTRRAVPATVPAHFLNHATGLSSSHQSTRGRRMLSMTIPLHRLAR